MSTFQEAIKVKVNKESNTCHLSIKTSNTKVEVFKLALGDMISLMAQFRSEMGKGEKKNNLRGKLIK